MVENNNMKKTRRKNGLPWTQEGFEAQIKDPGERREKPANKEIATGAFSSETDFTVQRRDLNLWTHGDHCQPQRPPQRYSSAAVDVKDWTSWC